MKKKFKKISKQKIRNKKKIKAKKKNLYSPSMLKSYLNCKYIIYNELFTVLLLFIFITFFKFSFSITSPKPNY